MRAALLGGTFNPIHYGHLRVGEEVFEGLGFDKVLFIPASVPPHKPHEAVTPPEFRLEMTGLATSGNPRFEVSDMELRRGGRSFTIDTVRELKERGLIVTIIVGTDQFNEITTWCEYEDLIKEASLVVVARPGYPVKKVGEALPVELARKFWYDSVADSYMNSFGTSVKYLKTTLMDISSSDIRERIRAGSSVRYLLPQEVIRYIEERGLYR